jgi:hypothetical protein
LLVADEDPAPDEEPELFPEDDVESDEADLLPVSDEDAAAPADFSALPVESPVVAGLELLLPA